MFCQIFSCFARFSHELRVRAISFDGISDCEGADPGRRTLASGMSGALMIYDGVCLEDLEQ
jgi:hypothetical protein